MDFCFNDNPLQLRSRSALGMKTDSRGPVTPICGPPPSFFLFTCFVFNHSTITAARDLPNQSRWSQAFHWRHSVTSC